MQAAKGTAFKFGDDVNTDVILPGKEKVTYVKVTPEMVSRIVAEHIVNGRVVTEYTIGAAEGK